MSSHFKFGIADFKNLYQSKLKPIKFDSKSFKDGFKLSITKDKIDIDLMIFFGYNYPSNPPTFVLEKPYLKHELIDNFGSIAIGKLYNWAATMNLIEMVEFCFDFICKLSVGQTEKLDTVNKEQSLRATIKGSLQSKSLEELLSIYHNPDLHMLKLSEEMRNENLSLANQIIKMQSKQFKCYRNI